MQINYPNEHDFTRIVEIKHATGQVLPVTTIVREYPRITGQGENHFIRSRRLTPRRCTRSTRRSLKEKPTSVS